VAPHSRHVRECEPIHTRQDQINQQDRDTLTVFKDFQRFTIIVRLFHIVTGRFEFARECVTQPCVILDNKYSF